MLEPTIIVSLHTVQFVTGALHFQQYWWHTVHKIQFDCPQTEGLSLYNKAEYFRVVNASAFVVAQKFAFENEISGFGVKVNLK